MMAQSFGVGTHAEMPVALAGAVYSVGASAIWFQWKNLFITPFYWLMAPVFRRIRRTTLAELVDDRYGPWMAAIYIVFALCFFIINMGSMLKGAGKVISQATGGGVGANEIVVAMTALFMLYSFVGGLIAAAWTDLFHADAKALGDAENAFGFACRQLLFPGALGLMIASILAANMSTCSAFLVDSGALFTEGLYRRRITPNREDRHYLWVGRASGFVITMLGVLYAIFLIESVLYTFLLTETLATYVGIGVLGGIVWPRANRRGALASLLASLATNFTLYAATGQRLDHWDPNVFLASLGIGTIALIVVSLLTQPEPQSRIHDLFERLQTSSDTPAVSAGADQSPSRPSGAERPVAPPQPLLLVNLLQLRLAAGPQGWRAYREDLGGFTAGWLIVFLVVIATAIMLRM
jgi:Na+/proline symporter